MRRVLPAIALGTALAAGPVLLSSAHAASPGPVITPTGPGTGPGIPTTVPPGGLTSPSFPALYVGGLTLGYNVPTCVQMMGAAMAKAGVSLAPASAIGVGGTTMTTRVYAVCVVRPRNGYCGADGATAVISAAGSDSKTLLQAVIAKVVYPKVGCL